MPKFQTVNCLTPINELSYEERAKGLVSYLRPRSAPIYTDSSTQVCLTYSCVNSYGKRRFMNRPYIRPGSSVPPPASTPFPLRPATPSSAPPEFGSWCDHLLVRLIFSVASVAAGYHLYPFGLTTWMAARIRSAFSMSEFLCEIR